MKSVAVAMFLLPTLAGCAKSGDARICTVPPPIEKTMASINDATKAGQSLEVRAGYEQIAEEGCVHRWAYRLAGSTDPAETVARAAFAGCDTSPAYNVDHRAHLLRTAEAVTDEPGYAANEVKRMVSLALFHVVQARAGKCPVPE